MGENGARYQRRDFLKTIGWGAAAAGLAGCQDSMRFPGASKQSEKPNFLWITCEDIGPALGCYGDTYAYTPHLDRLAEEGLVFTNAYATAPVCSPARSCLITGVYATSLGTQHLRSEVRLPSHITCFPEILRQAGYYCSNNYKQDYNFGAPRAWDESSKTAHWRNRKTDQPFFSVFNLMTTHQSRLDGPDPRFFAQFSSTLKPGHRHAPAAAPVPPFYPDTPVVRKTLARYYDLVSVMDGEVGHLLDALEKDGLAEDTIVFFFSDHGFGMPRFKRTLYDTGLKVPLIVRVPRKYQARFLVRPGERVDELVSFVDFAPTLLSLAGAAAGGHVQGQVFLGRGRAKPRSYIYGASSRVDEAYEMSRCVRDTRYKYIRNYMPHLPYAQRSAWPDQAEIAQHLKALAKEGKLQGTAGLFYGKSKPREELYDTHIDPYELRNLVDSPMHQFELQRLRKALGQWIEETRDIGFLPEAEMHRRSGTHTPYILANTPERYPLRRIVGAADLVGRGATVLSQAVNQMKDSDGAVRYWAAVALLAVGGEAAPAAGALREALNDPSAVVRFTAAEALVRLGQGERGLEVLAKGLSDERPWIVLHAARALQNVGERAAPVLEAIRRARGRSAGGLYEMFIRWALDGAIKNCEQPVVESDPSGDLPPGEEDDMSSN